MTRKHQILFEDDEIEAASSWYSGGSSMLYAISSTGALSLGTIRPRNEDGRSMTNDEWFTYLATNLEGEAEEALDQARAQMKGASRQEKDELRSDIAAFKSIIQKTKKVSGGLSGSEPELTAAQREYVQLFVEDVLRDPSSFKAAVSADPIEAAIREINGLDDRDVRQMTRELRAEIRRVKRLTGR